ncbi:hypothetical protein LTR62_000392 [Meristemomyces frigidus]|uniref:FAM192A/Fyv6 N-terminal domain-containing protein n=1 Tax=Meristemomyces frigidus TaxID=1508187 RepID=A0AAN7YIF4_9PEZI|nr:hypothetical protein LTR62_000392 [Meristemomyces frigidus]
MSRFVSAGTDEQPTERDEAWQKAQQQIEATKQPKLRPGEQEGGKSLYETLQANKAAKQDAFEEAARLRNQFQSLDEDDVEFLESVRESSRTKDEEVKRQTREQLEAFRKQQESAEMAARGQDVSGEASEGVAQSWSIAPRKRKKGYEVVGGVKLRKTSSAEKTVSPTSTVAEEAAAKVRGEDGLESEQANDEVGSAKVVDGAVRATVPASRSSVSSMRAVGPAKPALGLAAYSSDEDE